MGDINGGPGYGRGPQMARGGGWGRPQEPGYGGAYGYGGGPGANYSGMADAMIGRLQAPLLYRQYQQAAPGADRDALVRQMQGADNGVAYRQQMRDAGYTLNQGAGGAFSYAPPGTPQTGTYSSQGPPPAPRSADSVAGQNPGLGPTAQGPQMTPNQQLMLQSGRGQRGFWQGLTSPYGMGGPYGGGGGSPYGGPYSDPYGYGNYGQRVYGGGGGGGGGMPK